MESAFARHLGHLKRLGKVEREELRAVLVTETARLQFQECVGLLLSHHADANDEGLEDLFILGAQIADIWPDDEMGLELERVTRAVAAFSVGFAGEGFDKVFGRQPLEALQRQWNRSRDSGPLPRSKVGERQQRMPRARAIELQKHSAAAA
jgi:hypothetical protein